MPESIPQLDFSKQEDQDEFENLPQGQKEDVVENAQERAEILDEVRIALIKGDIDEAMEIKKTFSAAEKDFYISEIQEVALEVMKIKLAQGEGYDANRIKRAFLYLRKQELQGLHEVAFKGIIKLLNQGDLYSSEGVRDVVSIKEHDLRKYLTVRFKEGKLGELHAIDEKRFQDVFGYELVPAECRDENLRCVENIQNYLLNHIEELNYPWYSSNRIKSVEELDGEEKYKNIFKSLKNLKDTVWDNEGNNHEIANAFESGSEVFGYEKMFKFIGTHDRHDALFAFDKIIDLQQKAGLEPEQFFGQILHQVRMDSSVETEAVAGEYWQNEFGDDYQEEDGSEQIDAYQKLNNLAQGLESIDFEDILQKAEGYRDISSMNKLLNEIQSVEDIFANWKMLKKFGDIVNLLNQSEVLDELKELPEDKQELKKYIETLIFHPNINTTAVLQFWRNTYEFLDIYEEHASDSHELKKPSNYTDIPYLQLDAADLRDALVEQDLDKIQGFDSMEMSFIVPVDTEVSNLSMAELTKKVLGSFREKIQGEAQNPKKLFSEVQKIFKEQKVNLQEFLSGEQELNSEVQEQLKDLLLKSENGLKLKTKEYRAKISDKSDPDAVVAGNDTACCMPFGSGKNNVYTYNPNCGQFVIQEKSGDKWKTIAQSVLTKDVDIKMNIPEIVEAASSGHKSMSELATDEVLENQKEIIVCDNVEVAPNIGNSRDSLEIIYKEFFKQYLAGNADSDNLEQDKFLVGLGYNDLVFGEEIKNTFLPTAPVGYSDNVGEKVNQVKLSEKISPVVFSDIIKQSNIQKEKRELPKGINELTFADTLKVSYIEGKAYHDNQSLMEYMHNMENGLIAKDIYNAKNDKPNMSFSYTDNSDKMKGYLFAYEGEMNGEDVIYVADLAALPDTKMAGGKLIGTFLQEYKKQYLDKGEFRSISAHAREKTSYRIIEKQLNKLGKKIGVEFEMEELGSRFEEDDEMHEIIIRVKK